MNAPESPKAAAVRKPGHGSGGGFLLGLTAYALWGVLPVYFKALSAVPAVDIVAHRILWSLPFLAILILVTRGWDKVRDVAARPRTLGILFVTALLIGGNWLL
jgi:chloramphenicol-sensitive protein RarD